jgi:predicted membrane chloride channel (bestrophin family)
MVIFLLGFYTTTVISRWWETRMALQRVEGSVANLSLLATTYLRNSVAQNTRKMLVTYGLLVRALMVKQMAASGLRAVPLDVSDLINEEIMTHGEWGLLQNTDHRISVVLSWMSKLLLRAVSEQRLCAPESTLPMLQGSIQELRRVISDCAVLVESQLPFPCGYVD